VENSNVGGNVVKNDKFMGVSQLLGAPGCPLKVYVFVICEYLDPRE